MHDHRVAEHVASGAAQIAVSAAPTVYGLVTLNNLALVFGILASIAVLTNTLLNLFWNIQDRKAGRARRDA